MGFFDSLAANPGGSSIYGNSGAARPDYEAPMSIDEELRRRDLNSYKQKASFMSDLSLKQDRLRQIYGDQHQAAQPMNVVFKDNNPDITPMQKETLGVQKAGTKLAADKLASAVNLGQQRINLGEEKHDLDVDKNKNIYDTKQADLQRKHDEAQSKLALAEKALQNKQNDAKALADRHDAQMKAAEAKHNLDMAQRDSEHKASLAELTRMHDATIANLKKGQNVTTTEETNAEGTKRTKNVKKGSGGGTDDNDPLGIRSQD